MPPTLRHVTTTPTPRLAIYPGSFDPLTMGHMDIITRALTIFDQVTLVLADNPDKAGRHLLSLEERLATARQALAHLPGAHVTSTRGLLAHAAQNLHASAIIRGIRNGSDLDAETPMAHMNRFLGAPETIFLPADGTYGHVSSSLVKDVAWHGGDVSTLVPPAVLDTLLNAVEKKKAAH